MRDNWVGYIFPYKISTYSLKAENTWMKKWKTFFSPNSQETILVWARIIFLRLTYVINIHDSSKLYESTLFTIIKSFDKTVQLQ